MFGAALWKEWELWQLRLKTTELLPLSLADFGANVHENEFSC
jgi:hypothetical protein